MVVVGVVVHGRRLGRQLGFPTANVELVHGEELSNGVYRSRVRYKGELYDAISNVGSNPTVGGVEKRLESHLLDFSDDMYGATIEVSLLEKIRDEVHFTTIEQLKNQISEDVATVRKLISLPSIGNLV